MGDHNRLCPWTDGLFYGIKCRNICAEFNIHKYGNGLVLDNWVDGGGKPCGHGYDLVPWLYAAIF